jgi:RNA polymerase sigma-70 factor (ECF subfamily)
MAGSEARSAEEKDLVEKLQQGDEQAFKTFVRTYARSAFHLASRFTGGDKGGADDIVQESLMKAYRAIPQFRGESSLKNWFLRITANTAKNYLRSQNRHQGSDILDLEIGVINKDFQNQERAQTLAILQKAIEKLPPRQRETLHLRIFEDLSFKEISEILGTPFDTSKANFRHAVMNLKKILMTLDSGQGWTDIKLAFESLSEDEDNEK